MGWHVGWDVLLTPRRGIKVHPLGCWEFQGAIDSNGYGCVYIDGRRVRTHRVAYEADSGPIPEGLVIDHLCFNRRCINPAHLEAVTLGENTRRALRVGRGGGVKKTHCLRGHVFDEANTWVGATGRRACRACERIRKRELYWRDRER